MCTIFQRFFVDEMRSSFSELIGMDDMYEMDGWSCFG